MRRSAVLLALAAVSAGFAPAPFPRPLVAEAVLANQPGTRRNALSEKLVSPAFLAEVLKSKQVASVAALSGVKQPEAWLRSRLKAELTAKGKQVRVVIDHCPPKDALTLLTVIVDLGRKPDGPARQAATAFLDEARRKYEVILRICARGPRGAITPAEVAQAKEMVRRFQEELDGAKVLEKPRLVKRR